MKILYITTQGSTMEFFEEMIRAFIKKGHVVDIATNESNYPVPDCYREWECKIHQIACVRNPLKRENFKAIQQIKQIAAHYDIVHCHTPIAAACTRIACRGLRKNGVRVIYTAHGFHFYKGAPLLNWLIYYPIEKMCSRYTDDLITINKEDYRLSKDKFKKANTIYVPGVGISVNHFKNTVIDKNAKKKELGIPDNSMLLVSVGELNANKNHQIVIKALAQIKRNDLHYIIAGRGAAKEELEMLADELNIKEQVHFVGYRKDIAEIYHAADLCCFPSIREGLPVALLEAMACGLPIVAADNRGTRELIREEENGFLIKHNDILGFARAIKKIVENRKLAREMGEKGQQIAMHYDVSKIKQQMEKIYFKSNLDFTPKVSIIIPVFNGSNYMKEAIDSALSQTYKNLEILVINDGSTDDGKTESIAKEYGERIRYIAKENGGVSTALNVGIKNMRGEYFSWLSHDDVYTPDKIEKSIKALSEMKNKKTIVGCQSIHIGEDSRVLKGQKKKKAETQLCTWDDALMKLQKQGTMNGCSLLIHKDILVESGLFDETLRFNQDGFMWNKIFLKKYPFLIIPDMCVMNRIHKKQLTQTGQSIFHSDCERMSEFLIPQLIEISNKDKNFIVEYIKYNAKYANQKVVRMAYQCAIDNKLITWKEHFIILFWEKYGKIRPLIRRVYYRLFRKI